MERFYNTRENARSEREDDLARIININQQEVLDGSIELYELAVMMLDKPEDTSLAFQFIDVHETAINTVRQTGQKGKQGLKQFKRYIGAPIRHMRGFTKRCEINRRFNVIAKARYYALETL